MEQQPRASYFVSIQNGYNFFKFPNSWTLTVDDVSFLQWSHVGNTMTDHLIDGTGDQKGT